MEGKTPAVTNAGAGENQHVEPTKSKSDREHYSIARVLAQEGLYEDAAREFERAISINPKRGNYYDNLGYCLARLRRYDEAIQAFNHALLVDPKDAYALRESGNCFDYKKAYEKAGGPPKPSVVLQSAGEEGDRWLGYALNDPHRSGSSADSVKADDFKVNYSRGVSSLRQGRFEEAADSFGKAVEVRPEDFDSNFWRGTSLVRSGKFREAIPNLEKAHQIKKDDKPTQVELFGCYLTTRQHEKAFRIYPFFIAVIGGALTLFYLVGLAVLLLFSLRIREAVFPGFGFSLAWLGLFFEGQIAFVFLLALLFWVKLSENALIALVLAGIPIIVMAVTAFARQPWGEAFRWPLRFGERKVILLSLLLLLLSFLINFGFSELLRQTTHHPLPLQRIAPFIKEALNSNPLIAFFAIGFITPITEEILFRGLVFGALQKWLREGWVIFWTSLLFALVHFELIGLIPLIYLGAILGWARWKTGSVGLPILLHALNNCLALFAFKL